MISQGYASLCNIRKKKSYKSHTNIRINFSTNVMAFFIHLQKDNCDGQQRREMQLKRKSMTMMEKFKHITNVIHCFVDDIKHIFRIDQTTMMKCQQSIKMFLFLPKHSLPQSLTDFQAYLCYWHQLSYLLTFYWVILLHKYLLRSINSFYYF